MARKLKTYQTSLGFFDQAIAAPSMKAALEAWGADSNLFHQGAAKESDDPDVVAATMAKPGVVLKRPVGSTGPFREHAELPAKSGRRRKTEEGSTQAERPETEEGCRPARRQGGGAQGRPRLRTGAGRAASVNRRRKRPLRQKERERRQQAIDKAQAALDRAEAEHADRAAAIRAEAEALEKRSQAEEARWGKEKERLAAALKRARG